MMSFMTYKIRVKVDSKSYLPIEMLGDFSKIGKPGEVTRMNLTLGEDADGDGGPVREHQRGGVKNAAYFNRRPESILKTL